LSTPRLRVNAMTFREAMDRLCLSASDVAEMFGLETQTVRQMRMDPNIAGSRKPPDGWRAAFADVAIQRGDEMAWLAAQLAREAG
jgi:hypothetical protein